jgi:hypothetical protein
MKQTRQPVHAVKQSIYLDVYGWFLTLPPNRSKLMLLASDNHSNLVCQIMNDQTFCMNCYKHFFSPEIVSQVAVSMLKLFIPILNFLGLYGALPLTTLFPVELNFFAHKKTSIVFSFLKGVIEYQNLYFLKKYKV